MSASLLTRIVGRLTFTTAVVLLAPWSHAAEAPPAKPAAAPSDEQRGLIAMLQSDAPPERKAMACKRLAVVGTKEAVPALAALLADETLGCYARYGLETIPDPTADDALREALTRLQGARLAGVINSIGVRRDAKAVDGLVKALGDKDPDVASAAAIALGRIGNPAAAQSLQQALSAAPAATRPAVAEACLMCGEQRMREGKRDEAATIAEAVLKANVSKQIDVAAIRVSVLARQLAGLPQLIVGLKSPNDKARFGLALRLIREVPGPELTQVLIAELQKAPPEVQTLLIPAVVDRNDAAVRPTIEALAASADADVRKTAIGALGRIGGASSVSVLVKSVEAGKSPEESAAALTSLRCLPDPQSDALILQALPSVRAPVRAQLIGVLEDRNSLAAAGELLKLAAAPEAEVAQAALRALSVLARPGDLPEIVRILTVSKDESIRESAERAVVAACQRIPDVNRRADAVLAALRATPDTAGKCAVMRVLPRMANIPAYNALRVALDSPDQQIRTTALRGLANWPDVSPAGLLLEAVAAAKEPAQRAVALQGVLRMASTAAAGSDRPSPQVIAWFQQAGQAVRSVEEKRLLLSGLAHLACVEGLQMLQPCLDDASVQSEAALAVIRVAAKLKPPAERAMAKSLLLKIASTAKDAALRSQAVEAARKIPGPAAELKAPPAKISEEDRIEAAVPRKAFAAPRKPRRLLLFDVNVGYGGHPSRFTANTAFTLMGKKTGAFETVISRDPAVFKPESLRQFDAVFLNNTVGNLFEDPALRQSLIEFIYGGGGLMGVHGTSVAFTRWTEGAREDWPEFALMLGTRGAVHRASTEHVFIKLDDPDHPVCRPFGGQGFEYRDEFFRPQNPYSRHRDRVLLSIDTQKTDLTGQPRDRAYREDNDYALAWVRQHGRGRVFYSTIAHNTYVFWDTKMLEFYLAAAQFVLGDLSAPTTPSAKLTPAVRAQEQLGWRLGVETGAFGAATLFETLDKAAQLGVLYVGGSSGQKVSPEIATEFGPQLTDKELEQVRLKLDSAGLRMLTYAVKPMPADAEQCRKLFEFGRKMGIEALVAEPSPDTLAMLTKLCDQYDLKLSVGSRDVGQWLGSGVDPRQAAGMCKAQPLDLRLLEMPDAAGAAKLEQFLQELQQLGVKPVMFGVGRVGSAADPAPGMARTIEFFNQLSLRLAKRGTP